MNNEKNSGLNVDMADYHGLSSQGHDNPYRPPSSDEDPFSVQEYVDLGVGSYLALTFLLLWYGFWTWLNVAAGLERGRGVEGIEMPVLVLTVFLFLSHLLVLFKVEVARKIAVAHSYVLLIGIPVGTIVGIILLKSLKDKKFRRSSFN